MCKHKYMNVKFCTIFQLLMYKTFTHRFMYNCMLFANCFFLLPLKLPGLGFVLFSIRKRAFICAFYVSFTSPKSSD